MKTIITVLIIFIGSTCFGQRYFIKVKDGKAINYPIQEDNFKQAYPNIDIENLPDTFALVTKMKMPETTAYKKYIESVYTISGKKVIESHVVRDLLPLEKDELIQKYKESMKDFMKDKNYVFVDSLCTYVDPKMIKQ